MKIQIVNDNDQLIGIKERSDIDYQNDIFRISVLWITNSKGEVLLGKRSIVKDKDPGMWGPAVTGTVEEGETYESNIYKEAVEEIGLVNTKFTIGPKVRYTNPRNSFGQWYFVTIDRDINSFKLQTEEVDELMWIDIDDLKHELIVSPQKYTASVHKIFEILDL